MALITILVGDCRERMRELPAESIHCVVTSPPYWGLRDYGLPPSVWGGDSGCEHVWGDELVQHQRGQVGNSSTLGGGLQAGGNGRMQEARQGQFCQRCGAWRGCLGLEPTPELYTAHLVAVFREVKRVLRDDGTAWLNLGDSYAGQNYRGGRIESLSEKQKSNTGSLPFVGTQRKCPSGLKHKDLVGIPWRLAFALQADGWYLRRDLIWAKGISFLENYAGSSMPESVRDRPSTSHEYVFLLSKSARYFYDIEAVKEPSTGQKGEAANFARTTKDHLIPNQSAKQHRENREPTEDNGKRNLRSVWVINSKGFPGAHFATFPPALIEPMIKAGTSERGACPRCGAPCERVVEKTFIPQQDVSLQRGVRGGNGQKPLNESNTWQGFPRGTTQSETVGWRPTCACLGGFPGDEINQAEPLTPIPSTILDPFGGAGTVGLVAEKLGRDAILIDLNPEYAEMARRRILDECGAMFTKVKVE